MKKTLVLVGLVVVFLVGVSYVYARGPGFGPGRGPGFGLGGCPGFAGAANLSAEQKAQVGDLRQKHFAEVAPLREKMQNLRQELRTLWADPKADAAAIKNKTTEMAGLRDQMQDKMVQFRLDARNLLTPDQITALGEGCGRGGWNRGPGRGPGGGSY